MKIKFMKSVCLRSILMALFLMSSGAVAAKDRGQSIVLRFHPNRTVLFYVSSDGPRISGPEFIGDPRVKSELELKCGDTYRSSAVACLPFKTIDLEYNRIKIEDEAEIRKSLSGQEHFLDHLINNGRRLPIGRECSWIVVPYPNRGTPGRLRDPKCVDKVRSRVYDACLVAYETQCLSQDTLNSIEAEIESNYDRFIEMNKRVEEYQRANNAEIERLNDRIRLLIEGRDK